jgi:hypothetical protein
MYNIEAKFIKSDISESVTDLNENQKDDVLLSVTLEFTKTEVDVSASLKKEVKMNMDYLPENFVPLSEITEETKVQWALDSLSDKQWHGINFNLDKTLKYNAKYPKKENPVIKNKLDYDQVLRDRLSRESNQRIIN